MGARNGVGGAGGYRISATGDPSHKGGWRRARARLLAVGAIQYGVALARALSTNLSSVLISTIRARLDCLWRNAGASCRDRSYRGFARWPSLSFQIDGRCRGVSQGRFVLAASHRCLSSHGQSLIPSPVAATARLPVSSPDLRSFLAKQETGHLPSSTSLQPCGCSVWP